MKQIPITLLFVLTVSLLFGQDKLQLSLADAQNYAIEHNKTIQNAKLDVSSSESKFKEAISQGLPQIDAALDYTTYFGYEIAFNFGSGETPSYTNEQLINAATQTLSTFNGNAAAGHSRWTWPGNSF